MTYAQFKTMKPGTTLIKEDSEEKYLFLKALDNGNIWVWDLQYEETDIFIGGFNGRIEE